MDKNKILGFPDCSNLNKQSLAIFVLYIIEDNPESTPKFKVFDYYQKIEIK